MKSIVLWIIIVCVILIQFYCIFICYSSKRETFTDHMTVLLTKSTYSESPMTLAADIHDVNDKSMIDTLDKLFPLRVKMINYSNLNKSHLLVVPQMYNTLMLKHDYEFVGSLYPICLTMILPINSNVSTYTDLQNIKIGTFRNVSYDFLNIFGQIMNVSLSLIPCESYSELYSKWKNNEINAIFLMVSHPNQFVKLLSYQEEIKLFNWNTVFDNINLKRIINFHFQDIKKISMPIQSYRLFKLSRYYPTYGFYVNLISPKSISLERIYQLLKTIYLNISKLKINLDFAASLSPEWMSYCPPNMNYHKGAKAFYTDINLISEFSPKCHMLNTPCDEQSIYTIDNIISKRIGIL